MVTNGILHVLQACEKESGIKRVVMTSSSTAAASPQPNKVFTMDEKTWNTTAVEDAWKPPPYEGLQVSSHSCLYGSLLTFAYCSDVSMSIRQARPSPSKQHGSSWRRRSQASHSTRSCRMLTWVTFCLSNIKDIQVPLAGSEHYGTGSRATRTWSIIRPNTTLMCKTTLRFM